MFSVVIPLYNKATIIADTLKSVLEQSYDKFELIVVDDGSTDKSLSVVKSFSDSRLRVYTKINGGVSDARNYGIQKARYEYIAFLDADDLWENIFLEQIKKLIDKYPFCGLYASAYKRRTRRKTYVFGSDIPEGIVDDLFRVKLQYKVPCSSAITIKKSVFEEVGCFPVGMMAGEDDYTWSKIALKFKVAFTPEVLAIYNDIFATYSTRRGKIDYCRESWFDFYQDGCFYLNEFIAKKAITAGVRYAFGSYKERSLEIEELTRFTSLYKNEWNYLYKLNRKPYILIELLRRFLPIYQETKFHIGTLKRIIIKVKNKTRS